MTIETSDTSEARSVLSALIDREPVDPDALALVLEDPAARALLVDFVRLRVALAADDEDLIQATTARDRVPRSRIGRVVRPLAAALLLSAAGAGGLWLGERRGHDRPPAPSRSVSYTPGVDWVPR
jgi:hypothetical protein